MQLHLRARIVVGLRILLQMCHELLPALPVLVGDLDTATGEVVDEMGHHLRGWSLAFDWSVCGRRSNVIDKGKVWVGRERGREGEVEEGEVLFEEGEESVAQQQRGRDVGA